MHQSSGRWQLGLTLSLVTSLLWGMLPIALKGVLQDMDAATITWYRFLVAALIMWFFLSKKKLIPDLKWLKNKKQLFLFVIVTAGLTGNYLLYLMGLDYVTPSAAQVVIQIAPLMLLVGGLIIFREKFSFLQWLGLLTFITGLGLFFNHRIETIIDAQSNYSLGLLFIVFAAVMWAAYALAQKQLLNHYSSQQVMFIVYIVGSVVYLPTVDFNAVTQLSNLQLGLLLFCCLNTLIAYGSFAEALEHWEATRVSAVLAITPLITIAFAALTNYFYPGYLVVEDLNSLSIIGAIVLVAGATLTALSNNKK